MKTRMSLTSIRGYPGLPPILIKKGCWIGQNVVIFPGVMIGVLSIIGTNSVVTKSIPDRCIAIGSPAKVIKKWDENAQQWVSVARMDKQQIVDIHN